MTSSSSLSAPSTKAFSNGSALFPSPCLRGGAKSVQLLVCLCSGVRSDHLALLCLRAHRRVVQTHAGRRAVAASRPSTSHNVWPGHLRAQVIPLLRRAHSCKLSAPCTLCSARLALGGAESVPNHLKQFSSSKQTDSKIVPDHHARRRLREGWWRRRSQDCCHHRSFFCKYLLFMV